MPDLQRASAIDWLYTVEPAFSRRLTAPVRPIEDVAAVHPLLVTLGTALDQQLGQWPEGLVPKLLEGSSLLQDVLAQLGPARLLRLLAWFETAGLPRGEELIDALLRDERSEAGRHLRATLGELQRQSLLARIFHPDRLALLQSVVSSQKDAL